MISYRCNLTVVLAAGLLIGSCTSQNGRATEQLSGVPVGQFIKKWLICGDFPNPPHEGQSFYDHTHPCVGLETDYLKEHGGEKNIVPVIGMKHQRPDKTTAEWFEHQSQTNIVDLRNVLTKRYKDRLLDNVVAYAYANIQAEQDCKKLLTVGSDDGVRICLNGELVHDRLAKSNRLDADLLVISLKKGSNHLLVKVTQGSGSWGFALRFLNLHQILSDVNCDLDRLKIGVSMRGAPAVIGEEVSVVDGDRLLTRVDMTEGADGMAVGHTEIAYPEYSRTYDNLGIVIGGQSCGKPQLPDLHYQRGNRLRFLSPRGYPPVFSGETFPPIDFERPLWIEKLIGPYTLSTTYYDSKYNKVQQATQPGRYGAVVTIKTATDSTRRFVTLFRQPEDIDWERNDIWERHDIRVEIELPEELGVPEPTAISHKEWINEFVKSQISRGLSHRPGSAILLAGLYEASKDASKPDFYNSPGASDERWWLGFKRKLYGLDKKYPKPFVCPSKIDGRPAGVIRKGTLKEAGMKPDFPERLDKYTTKWVKDTEEACAVIVVRHGVIAFHKAYGTRDGKPMTLSTKSWMASITKMLSGTLVMMLVDQGLLSLDDRADEFLPPLRGLKKGFPATIRHLQTHTSGMPHACSWWGHDKEERVATMVPFYQEVGKAFDYTDGGPQLCGVILRLISGETLGEFYRNNLLNPLDCKNTEVSTACCGARSTPLDMARISQMLLQKGVYGDKRFFREETFKQMLPEKLTKVLGPDTDRVWGIGTSLFEHKGLGKDTFGHGAKSGAIVRIDPDNDMVIIMTRNSPGKNYAGYRGGFFNIIGDSIVD
ncbi:MAG: serine hydrolase domain-containing protein [Planctomycetota bacterium]|jgi:CubicO group peptidase (beta-lactamase class C family)